MAVGLAGYVPVWDQLRQASSGGGGAWAAAALAGRCFVDFFHDSWGLIPAGLVACWLLVRGGPDRGDGRSDFAFEALEAVALLVGPFVLAGLLRASSFERNFTPLLPVAAVYVGRLVATLERRSRGSAARWMGAMAVGVLLVPAVVGVALYPARLELQRRAGLVQGGYYVYYGARFEPRRALEAWAASIPAGEGHLLAYAKSDHWVVRHYLMQMNFPARRQPGPEAGVRLYVFAPEPFDPRAVAEHVGIEAGLVERTEPWIPCGHYVVRRSPEWLVPPR
jgi:hypothetical protein